MIESNLADEDLLVIGLEPWTVYGRLVQEVGPAAGGIDVCDIGVLPPPGCYLGTLSGETGPIRARLTVCPRRTCEHAGYRLVGYEVIGPGRLAQQSAVTVVFDAVQVPVQETSVHGTASGLTIGV